MKGTPEEVLKTVPDYDTFMELIETIKQLMFRKMSLESQIKDGEAQVFQVVNSNEKYFQGGKPPSVAYIDNMYKYRGINGELIPIREELVKVIAELEGRKLQMDIYKTMIDVWRTLCSNQRIASM